MPLFHVHGLLAGFLAPLLSGGSVIVPQKFSASEFWDHFITYKANWYTAVPTIHQILLKNPQPQTKPRIRFIRSCSSPLSPKTFHELEKAFNAPVLEAYAMTEAAHQMTSNPLPPGKRYPGSVGIGQGVEVKILDQEGKEVPQGAEAEICIRGENVTKGYLNNPEANKTSFTKEGFFRTGDQGKQDEDGYVIITGRIKELINKGGEKISPTELDNAVAHNPSVGEAVSFAIPDEMYGQDVGVAVVLKEGKQMTEDELRGWLATRVAKFKVPKRVSSPYSRRSVAVVTLLRSISRRACQRQLRGRYNAGWLQMPCRSKIDRKPNCNKLPRFFCLRGLLLYSCSSLVCCWYYPLPPLMVCSGEVITQVQHGDIHRRAHPLWHSFPSHWAQASVLMCYVYLTILRAKPLCNHFQ